MGSGGREGRGDGRGGGGNGWKRGGGGWRWECIERVVMPGSALGPSLRGWKLAVMEIGGGWGGGGEGKLPVTRGEKDRYIKTCPVFGAG